MKKSQPIDSSKPSIKARIRNFMPLHLKRGQKIDIYLKDEIVWLTPDEAKQYQHLIEIEAD